MAGTRVVADSRLEPSTLLNGWRLMNRDGASKQEQQASTFAGA